MWWPPSLRCMHTTAAHMVPVWTHCTCLYVCTGFQQNQWQSFYLCTKLYMALHNIIYTCKLVIKQSAHSGLQNGVLLLARWCFLWIYTLIQKPSLSFKKKKKLKTIFYFHNHGFYSLCINDNAFSALFSSVWICQYGSMNAFINTKTFVVE